MEEKKNPFASLSDKELEAMLKRLEDSNERQASYAKSSTGCPRLPRWPAF